MDDTRAIASPEKLIEALAHSDTKRPSGLVDWMHYGYFLRYGGAWDPAPGEEELKVLEGLVTDAERSLRSQILPLVEARSWTAGRLMLRRLPESLWPELSPIARGRHLAGLSRHMSRASQSMEAIIGDSVSGAPELVAMDVAGSILERLPEALLDSESAAEIGANAIHADRLDVLQMVLARPDLPEDSVPRICGYREQVSFEGQLSKHSTRLLDVLLEAAVRCLRPEAARLLLERGASPNIPCWNLERSFQEWFSSLSFAIHAQRERSDANVPAAIVDLLLQHGADPQGLDCEGKNNPLMQAMLWKQWPLADRLLALGARFEGGQVSTAEDVRRYSTQIPSAYPRLGFREKKDLDWVEQSIAPLVPLAEIAHLPLYYQAHAMIGSVSTFLNSVLADEQLPNLKKYEALGLPTTLTSTLILDIVDGGCHAALCHLLRNNPNLPRVMFRIRRRKHDFGVASRQVVMCQPEQDGSNLLSNFDPGALEPLQLPDGSRVHANLDCIAPPRHDHGPITEGCFWLAKIHAEYTRRRDRIVTHNIRRVWRMEPVPANVHQIPRLVPLVKEVDGKFIWLGVTAHCLRFDQKVPANWRAAVGAWVEGEPWQRVVQKFTERLEAQRATNIELPTPVLNEDELKPYPREFWPFLCRLKNGTIGMTDGSCRAKPDVLDIYSVWERQNKPDKDFQPDPRLLEWPMWPRVPVELRPYFYFDELFSKPSVSFKARNAYEKEMIHKAVQWNNEWMIQSLKDAGIA